MRLGITLAFTHTAVWPDLVRLADDLGIESAWYPDHFVLPDKVSGGPESDHADAIAPETPLFDDFAVMGHAAALTSRIRLGTNVYLAALRHPVSTARGFVTLDHLSGGRIEMGVGAGWLRGEFDAAGLPFGRRGRALDEALAVIRRLWTEEVVGHDGEFWQWDPVRFEPKPLANGIPISIGGVSTPALRRAAAHGDGWISLPHESPTTLAPQLTELREHCHAAGREQLPEVTALMLAPPPVHELADWQAAGVQRIIMRPWSRTSTALTELRQFAEVYRDHLTPGP